ncbi:MAG: hypothetical protein HUU57_13600 [Bdellovibrio sp.]|nr:hypothetical protein [Bdellovibrio sp.]
MQNKKALQIVLIVAAFFFASTLVQAAPAANSADYEEVSYDDLLNELNAKKKTMIRTQSNSLDATRIHAGIGYANTFSNISTQQQNFSRHTSGIQLSVGMDLFSTNWYSEGVFRNYGLTSSGSEELTLREVDLKIGYTNRLESIWNYSISSGLSNRFMRFVDPTRNIDVDDVTPSLIISTGFSAQVHRNLSIGAEASAKSAIVNRTADKNSFDFAFRITTSL